MKSEADGNDETLAERTVDFDALAEEKKLKFENGNVAIS
jgi:hypothetical protein